MQATGIKVDAALFRKMFAADGTFDASSLVALETYYAENVSEIINNPILKESWNNLFEAIEKS